MHVAQHGAGINAELVDQPLTHLPVGVERFSLSAAAVLGKHQLSGQAFVQWVRLDRRHEFTEQVRVPSCLQRSVVTIQRGRIAFRLKGVAHIVDPRCVKRCERLPAPQAECAVEEGGRFGRVGGRPGLRCDVSEAVDVHGQCIGLQHVGTGLADDLYVGAGQQLTQSRYICGEGVAGPVWSVVRPHPVDQLVGRNGIVDVDKQCRQNAPLACMPDVQPLPVEQSLDVAEQPELHRHAIQPPPGRRATGGFCSFVGS